MSLALIKIESLSATKLQALPSDWGVTEGVSSWLFEEPESRRIILRNLVIREKRRAYNQIRNQLSKMDHSLLAGLASGVANIDETLSALQETPATLPQGSSPVTRFMLLSETRFSPEPNEAMTVARFLLFAELLDHQPSREDHLRQNASSQRFYTWANIQSIINELLKKYSSILSLHSLGKTHEGRDIPLLKVSDNPNVDEEEPEILFTAGMHPREQQPQVALISLLRDLLQGYSHNQRITDLINEREIWIIPVLNVDGKIYDFSLGTSRSRRKYWRKNRKKNPSGGFSVDLNRNFPVRWVRSSRQEYKEDFPGVGPATEPETQALIKFLSSRPLSLFVDLHSYMGATIVPRFITDDEALVYKTLLQGIKIRQKSPYSFNEPRGSQVPLPNPWKGAGLGFVWAYYTQGIRSINLEVRGKGFYHSVASSQAEYQNNLKKPLFYLIDTCKTLAVASEGSINLVSYSTDTPLVPGAHLSLQTQLSEDFDFAVLVSHSPAIRVPSEYRLRPQKNGFNLIVMGSTPRGAEIPMSLFVWDQSRRRSVIHFSLSIN
jgi:hypothetical protein